MQNKKVSVIIPSYNHANYVTQAVESVLNQSYSNFELIVLDDGSKDRSKDVLMSLTQKNQFKLILKENEGLCATLNMGLDIATGDYIVLLASDDTMPVDRLKEQVVFLEKNPSVDVVAGGMDLMDEKSLILESKKPSVQGPLDFNMMLRRNHVLAPTAMIRKSVYDRLGKYRPDFAFEDYYLWLKILKNGGSIVNTDAIWASYRLDASSFEKKFLWYFKGYAQILSEYLPDQRVSWLIQRSRMIFGLKMSLLIGRDIFTKYQNELKGLPFMIRATLQIITVFPQHFRQVFLNALLRRY